MPTMLSRIALTFVSVPRSRSISSSSAGTSWRDAAMNVASQC
jgi:hypothetical protein